MRRALSRRLGGAGLAASAVVCPCHVLAGAVVAAAAAVTGAAPELSPALQDGVHAVYLPVAVFLGAKLLSTRRLPTRRLLQPSGRRST